MFLIKYSKRTVFCDKRTSSANCPKEPKSKNCDMYFFKNTSYTSYILEPCIDDFWLLHLTLANFISIDCNLNSLWTTFCKKAALNKEEFWNYNVPVPRSQSRYLNLCSLISSGYAMKHAMELRTWITWCTYYIHLTSSVPLFHYYQTRATGCTKLFKRLHYANLAT